MKYLLVCFAFMHFAQAQKFIPLDDETLEFVGQVNYTLYANKKPIFSSITSKDSVTRLPKEVVFDSIAFAKLRYKETGLKKEHLAEVVLLKKTAYELDEVVITHSKPTEIPIGEESRFVRRSSRYLSDSINFGLLFHDYDLKNMAIKKLSFFVEKVKYKTTYKIKFYAAEEMGNPIISQHLKVKELLFESPILTLEPGTKNKVEINLEDYDIDTNNEDVFVCIESQSYYDENNAIFLPQNKDRTRLKVQLSKLINYYSKTYDITTGMASKEMTNINVMINYDFAFQFFKKPHKSVLIAPAIILYGIKKI